MRSIILTTCLAALFLSACQEDATQPIVDLPLMGTWVESRYENDVTIMRRASTLEADNYGFVFGEKGKFLERKNAGWCGTPPISYDNFAGEWSRQAGNLVHVDVDYWG